jgi:hypothetical protein
MPIGSSGLGALRGFLKIISDVPLPLGGGTYDAFLS